MARRPAYGRRLKLTPTMQQAAVELLRNTGCTYRHVAVRLGVAESTFHKWLVDYKSFSEAIEQAVNDFELGIYARARAQASTDSKSLQWLAEHHPRVRAGWMAPKQELGVTLSGSSEVTVTHGLSAGTADAFERLAALAASLDVMVRVGVVPQLGAGPAGPRRVGPVDDAEDDEVHPA